MGKDIFETNLKGFCEFADFEEFWIELCIWFKLAVLCIWRKLDPCNYIRAIAKAKLRSWSTFKKRKL